MNKRSIGITIVGRMEVVLGVLGIVLNLAIIFYLLHSQRAVIKHNPLVLVTYFPPFVVPMSFLIFGNGLLALRKWAWLGNVFILPILLLTTLFVYSKWKEYWVSEIICLNCLYFGLLFFVEIFLARKTAQVQFNNREVSKRLVG